MFSICQTEVLRLCEPQPVHAVQVLDPDPFLPGSHIPVWCPEQGTSGLGPRGNCGDILLAHQWTELRKISPHHFVEARGCQHKDGVVPRQGCALEVTEMMWLKPPLTSQHPPRCRRSLPRMEHAKFTWSLPLLLYIQNTGFFFWGGVEELFFLHCKCDAQSQKQI